MDWQWLATWLVILFSAVTVLRRIPGLRSVTRGSGTATPLVQLGVGGVSGPTAGVAAEGHD
jgi:hypothetical protein